VAAACPSLRATLQRRPGQRLVTIEDLGVVAERAGGGDRRLRAHQILHLVRGAEQPLERVLDRHRAGA